MPSAVQAKNCFSSTELSLLESTEVDVKWGLTDLTFPFTDTNSRSTFSFRFQQETIELDVFEFEYDIKIFFENEKGSAPEKTS